MIKRILAGTAAIILVGGVAALNLSPIGRVYLPSGTGIVAKQICSQTWVAGLDSDFAREVYLDPLLGGAASVITTQIDEEARSVSAGVFGIFWQQTAVWRDGLGCTLVHDAGTFDADLTVPVSQDFQPMEIDADFRDTHFDTSALEAAIDAAFGDPETDDRNTLGVAVLYQGQLVAERYAPQASRETRFHGWSMTKSTMATLAGRLQYQGLIDIDAEGSVPALSAVSPDYEDVTIDALLRMAGGFAIAELNDGTDPNSQMLFTQSDMAHFAATRERLYAPLEHWQYMSGNTIMATHAMQQFLGDDIPSRVQGLREILFEPLGMYSPILEIDEAGTFQGSSYMYATAQDWARLAWLYANDGVYAGERLLPEDWNEIVSTPTDGSDRAYGMGFWLPSEHDGVPEGTFMMSGFQSQWGFIMPEQDLVVVRFGATNRTSSRSYELAAAVVSALREPQDGIETDLVTQPE
ncbi:serine hydrolase domain-containing protein [Maricaulis parjimensis]|uniref:serine hydrolase domain-containing protein n=1 Tax=Maricaulis parjimensis TaxID=144023 RepID=UPI001939A970|nr:serine hydrolase [Maricaulis parjimensis]